MQEDGAVFLSLEGAVFCIGPVSNIPLILLSVSPVLLSKVSMSSLPPCPSCQSEYVYQDRDLLVCPECCHEWNPQELAEEELIVVKDSNGTLLSEGDKVTFIKDLKVKGSSQVLKIGTKAVVRRINDGKDHQLDCKLDGGGEMMVTAKFVKRA